MKDKGGIMMGREVAAIRPRILEIVGCGVCATGIAVDVVGARWGIQEYDWKGGAFGHACAFSKRGPTAAEMERVHAIQAELGELPRDGAQTAVPF